MGKIVNVLTEHRHAIWWTVGYTAIMYVILLFLFDFDMMSARHWSILIRAQLRGFAGFVFGILILAAVPTYIATMTLVIRKKKPFFEIFPAKKKPEETKSAISNQESAIPEPPALPHNMPTELRGAFLRARANMPTPASALANNSTPQITPTTAEPKPESTTVATQPTPEPIPVMVVPVPSGDKSAIDNPQSAIPMPDDFDFTAPDSIGFSDAPAFKEITFGESAPGPQRGDGNQESAISNKLVEYLKNKNIEFEVENDIVITNNMAVAVHDDPDFWIADAENWFATGKQKASPITAAIAVATAYGATPALYLGEQNIMDLDNKITEWESVGVKIIRNLTEL